MVLMLLLFLVESLENSLFHQFWIAAVNICSESMAGFRLSRSTGITTCSRWKQWWRRSPNTCCSKKILLLLMWNMLFSFSWYVVTFTCGFQYRLIVKDWNVRQRIAYVPNNTIVALSCVEVAPTIWLLWLLNNMRTLACYYNGYSH